MVKETLLELGCFHSGYKIFIPIALCFIDQSYSTLVKLSCLDTFHVFYFADQVTFHEHCLEARMLA